jgi:hypothetical protein
MYEKLLEILEKKIDHLIDKDLLEDWSGILLDLIIKIKTIQAMDVSAELIRESRQINRKPTFKEDTNWQHFQENTQQTKYSGI